MLKTRKELIDNIVNHLNSEVDLTIADVNLINELIFALTWTNESHNLAHRRMIPLVDLNNFYRRVRDAST